MRYFKPYAEIAAEDLNELEIMLARYYLQPPPEYHASAEAANSGWGGPLYEPHRRIIAAAPAGATVLDVGCGPAAAAPRFAAAGALYTGLDVSPETIKADREKYPELEFIQGDWREAPGLGRSFDLVVSFFVLEHIARPKEFLSASAAAVRPGGLLAVLCPDYMRRGDMPSQHFFGRERGGLRAKLGSMDFADFFRSAYERIVEYPALFSRARLAASSGGLWLINLKPLCLEGLGWRTDWDAVYAAGEGEVCGYLRSLGFKIEARGEEIDGGRHGFCYVLARKPA